MASKKLNILAPTRYPWTFNGPRMSRHNIDRRNFIPFNKVPISKAATALEGLTAFNPFPLKKFDLIHAFNRIPLSINTPFIIGFESHMPRMYGMEKTRFFEYVSRSLINSKCKGIYPFSNIAKKIFTHHHQDFPWFDELSEKMNVRYPNIIVPDEKDLFTDEGRDQTVRLVFVGSHFARKGGCICVRMAEKAYKEGFPLELHVISSLNVSSWTDPTRQSFFDPDLKRLKNLPNVIHHGSMPNDDVLSLLKRAHFVMLPTFSDTFGFSVIEAMAFHTPAIVTSQGVFPEFLEDGENSIILPLDCNEFNEWNGQDYVHRHTEKYEKTFNDETEKLTSLAYDRLKETVNNKSKYLDMRKKAYQTAKEKFCAREASDFWDDIYERAVYGG